MSVLGSNSTKTKLFLFVEDETSTGIVRGCLFEKLVGFRAKKPSNSVLLASGIEDGLIFFFLNTETFH